MSDTRAASPAESLAYRKAFRQRVLQLAGRWQAHALARTMGLAEWEALACGPGTVWQVAFQMGSDQDALRFRLRLRHAPLR